MLAVKNYMSFNVFVKPVPAYTAQSTSLDSNRFWVNGFQISPEKAQQWKALKPRHSWCQSFNVENNVEQYLRWRTALCQADQQAHESEFQGASWLLNLWNASEAIKNAMLPK